MGLVGRQSQVMVSWPDEERPHGGLMVATVSERYCQISPTCEFCTILVVSTLDSGTQECKLNIPSKTFNYLPTYMVYSM